MKILDDLILALKGRDCPVKSVHPCAFWTAVVTKQCGLSLPFREEGVPRDRVLDKVIRSISEGVTYKEVTGVRLLTLTKD